MVRGVNLGGWLLLGRWITPVFFEDVNIGELQDKIVDEWTYAELLDPDTYQERMVQLAIGTGLSPGRTWSCWSRPVSAT